MKRLIVFSLAVVLTVAFSATAQRLTPEEIGKNLYYDAVKAYQNGTFNRDQLDILHRTSFFSRDENNYFRTIGGPDVFGYYWTDSEEPDISFDWIDIAGTGTDVSGLMGDDNLAGPFEIGIDFSFYGQMYSQFWIQSNGAIMFTDEQVSLSNESIPTDSYGPMIAWFWDDLDPENPDQNGDVGGWTYYETITVDGMDALVIQFVDWELFEQGENVPQQTAEVILFSDGRIKIQWLAVDDEYDISGNTCGIQNQSGTVGLEVWFDGSLQGYPNSEYAVEFNRLQTDAVLTGYVYDELMNTPIAGANVVVGGYSTTTDPAGYYEFSNIPAGGYSYRVTALGYWDLEGTLTVGDGTNTRDFYLEQFEGADILIFEGDPIPSSAAICQAVFEDLGFTTYLTTDWEEVPWGSFEAVFCFLGIYPNYFAIYTGDPIETQMVDYLNSGGNLYLESNDLFAFNSPQNLLAMLPLTNLSDGSADLSSVTGEDGTFMEGANMTYTGENSFIDEFNAAGDGAIDLLYNPADGEGCGVIQNGADYNTACFSFEVGMLEDDGDFTLNYLFEGLFTYWDMDPIPDPVELTVTGTVTQVPPAGGQIMYDVRLQSILPNVIPGVAYWTDVVLPSGTEYGPLMYVPFTIVPYMDVTIIGMTQNVPGIAPPGTYTFRGWAGYFGGPHLVDGFEFIKSGTAPGGIDNWNAGGTFTVAGDEATSAQLPTDYALEKVYPNPFNPSTNVTVALPEAADLTVTVFNVMGQQVTELARGTFSAGMHDFVLDGFALSSGVYFVKAYVPGELDQIQKVTLLR